MTAYAAQRMSRNELLELVRRGYSQPTSGGYNRNMAGEVERVLVATEAECRRIGLIK
jgi:hypothetical protein